MARWHNFIRKIKSDDSKHRYEKGVCKNCDTIFSGNFCPECGQSVKDYDRPFSFIFFNFLGDFFAFDTRFFRTLAALLVKPGFLTIQYFEGKRVRYAPPFRIFIFVSFILFLLLQIYTNRGLTEVIDSNISKSNLNAIDSVTIAELDSSFSETKAEIDTIIGEQDFNFDLADFIGSSSLRSILDNVAVIIEDELAEETNPKRIEKLREYLLLTEYPQQAIARFLKYLSWAFFLLLPIFAFIMKLLYIRRKQNYIRHLIFSIHIHSFIFVVFTIILLIHFINSGIVDSQFATVSEILRKVSFVFLLTIPVYFNIALKKFYGQSWGKVILKFISVSFIYNMVFWATVIVVFLNAIGVI